MVTLSSLFILLCALVGAAPQPAPRPAVRLGIDVLLEERIELLAGKHVGLVTNSSAVDSAGQATLDRMVGDARFSVTQLYAPEHGLRLEHRNGSSDPNGVDPVTGIALEGLSCARPPSPASLARVDVIVFDVQDVGSRTYTYATTLGKVMRAAARAHVPVIVLDRPNPGGGLHYEGPIVEARHRSMIGWGPLPVTHGLTFGELARFYNGELNLGSDLTVVPMSGWTRSMVWEDTGLRWVATSTGIPTLINAHLYVAAGMAGGSGTNVDDGVGSHRYFERIGAAFADADRFAAEMERAALPGVHFDPVRYRPDRGPYRGWSLQGIEMKVTDPRKFRPLRTALQALVTLHHLYPRDFRVVDWRRFARVWGNRAVLGALRRGDAAEQIEASWQPELERFGATRQKYLMYM